MTSTSILTYQIATEEWHFEAIHRLNYQTFVEEIPQHERNRAKRLVDKFHHENTYIICLRGRQLLGMVAVRAKRPFSLDEKLHGLDAHLPAGRSLCEIRLLAIEPNERSGIIFHGLICALLDHCRKQGYDLAVISGTVRQLKLYKHLGFVPFGPLVGPDDAKYQPMYIPVEVIGFGSDRKICPPRRSTVTESPANFLPGPVSIRETVRHRFTERPVSHRSESFVADFKATQRLLRDTVKANHVEILMGSGTLANDTIAAQLSLFSVPGLVLSNGEFGERLVDHANRFGLSYEVVRTDWGDVFRRDQIRDAIARNPAVRWLWAVHCETSTGVLNDLPMLKEICAENQLALNMDCISSIGTVPVDLTGVYLASGVSGKGLGAFPGLSMIFHERDLDAASKQLPRYLDLGYYSINDGIPFTISSNLLSALRTALERHANRDLAPIASMTASLRAELRDMGIQIVGNERSLSPAITTLALPPDVNSRILGKKLEQAGYLLSYMSGYLLERNWVQVCLMGEVCELELRSLLKELRLAIVEQFLRGARPSLLLAQAS